MSLDSSISSLFSTSLGGAYASPYSSLLGNGSSGAVSTAANAYNTQSEGLEHAATAFSQYMNFANTQLADDADDGGYSDDADAGLPLLPGLSGGGLV